MTPREVNALLAYCALFDRRTLGDPETKAWHDVVGDLPLDVARDAVRWHYRRETRWIMPADIAVYAKRFAPRPRKSIESTPAQFERTPEQQAYVESQVARLREFVQSAYKKGSDDAS